MPSKTRHGLKWLRLEEDQEGTDILKAVLNWSSSKTPPISTVECHARAMKSRCPTTDYVCCDEYKDWDITVLGIKTNLRLEQP